VAYHRGLPQIRTKEESLEHADDLPEPEELATDALAELEGAVLELNAVLAFLENGEKK
jgi:type I restriction enzyme M protein